MKSVKKVELDNARWLKRMALFNKATNILITDSWKGLIHVCDLNGNLLKSVNPGCLELPLGICVASRKNKEEEIYVYDRKAAALFVFSCGFQFIKTIGENLKSVSNITIDFESNILYCVHRTYNVVTLWNVNDGKLIKEFEIEEPKHLKISESKIYILSLSVCDSEKRKIVKTKRDSYINVLDRFSLKIIHKIQFDDWFHPYSLHLSSDSNIYTIAWEFNKSELYSKNKFLFIIDSKNYEIQRKIELCDFQNFRDRLYANNKLILCEVDGKWKELSIIEFD